MSGVAKKLMGTTAAGGGGLEIAIEEVFSTYLYTGNRTARDIVNGIDLAGEGGMVWTSARNVADNKRIWDSERGVNKDISTNSTAAQSTRTGALTAFNADGFSLGADPAGVVNADSGETYASWTFRKAPRFFDVVTYTGEPTTSKTISHNLGSVPGMIIVKRTDAVGNWAVYHRSTGETKFLELEDTIAATTNSSYWFDTAPTDTQFTVGSDSAVNTDGATYVAYLFAHDPLGPSGDGSDGLIACGSYTGASSGLINVSLGWEPQWLLIKKSSGGDTLSDISGWFLFDTMRGITTNYSDPFLLANSSLEENGLNNLISVTATGFELVANNLDVSASGSDYIYIAIRRGPMRAPESGTEVFDAELFTEASTVFQPDFPPDMNLHLFNRSAGGGVRNGSRMTGNSAFLTTSSTGAEGSYAGSWKYDGPTGTFAQGLSTGTSSGGIQMMFRRAPEFFDVVAFTGTGAGSFNHNLGAVPELMIIKQRAVAGNSWGVYSAPTGNTDWLALQATQAAVSDSTMWNNTTPTDTVFTIGSTSRFSGTCIAYLFATLAGVSKVGSYTGNGTSQTIDCGFTTGARFILIKRTDSTGDWYVWDTARGIVAANDPHLSLNTTAAEVTTDDSIDPDSSGFIVNQVAATNINVSAASYIFYAVA